MRTNHQGSGDISSASTGRRHDRSRDVHNSFKATLDHGAPSRHDRYLRKAEVQGLQKRGAQHVRIKGAGYGLVADGCVGIAGPKIGEWFLPVSIFFSVWPADEVGGDYTSRKGSSAASPPDCD